MNQTNSELEIDLLRLVRALWRRAWIIALAVVVFTAGAVGITAACVDPLYKAKALMYVNSNNISVGGTKLSISESELTAAQSLVDTYIVILNTRTTMEDVIALSGVNYTYEQMMSQGMVKASAVNGTEIFAIEVTSTDPAEAELLANTIARVLPEKIASIVEGSSARIVDYAVAPKSKASPDLKESAAAGALAGFLLSCGAVLLGELLDEKIHDSDYLLQTYGIPVLAVIPDLTAEGEDGYEYRQPKRKSGRE